MGDVLQQTGLIANGKTLISQGYYQFHCGPWRSRIICFDMWYGMIEDLFELPMGIRWYGILRVRHGNHRLWYIIYFHGSRSMAHHISRVPGETAWGEAVLICQDELGMKGVFWRCQRPFLGFWILLQLVKRRFFTVL